MFDNKKNDSEPTWENQLKAARKLTTKELKPHAAVSTDNRHRCEDCFCCAAGRVLEERKGKEYTALNGLHIDGRRWFNSGPGNTYHSVRIYGNGECVAVLPYQYGYGDCYLQTAIDWLKENGYAPKDAEYGTLYLREVLGGTYSVADVQRKKDL